MANEEVVPNRFGPDTRHDFHVLKDGDLFAVFPASGEINARDATVAEARSKDGLFFRDTRYLSRLSLSINGTGLIELGHDARPDDAGFRSDLANSRLTDRLGTEFLDFELHIRRERFLSDGLYDQIEISNYGTETAELDIVIECWADFRDIFEIRGAEPTERGDALPTAFEGSEIRFGYATADGRTLSTRVRLDPAPRFDSGRAHVELSLPPKARRQISCTVHVSEEARETDTGAEDVGARHGWQDPTHPTPSFAEAKTAITARMNDRIDRLRRIRTSRPSFEAWLSRSASDLAILTADLPTGPYPYAGVPWFSVPFGRDGLIAALQTLWLDAGIAAGVLDFLAATQATKVDAFCDAEPGKILHEHRNGELARTGAVPFHHYYGGIDQTLLFVVLAHAYWTRTGDRDRLHRLLPAIRAAMDWATVYGDRDGDGFIEYARSAETGLKNQGWKDSEDAVFHADGTLCVSPVALVEVQGYYVAALRAAAELFAAFDTEDDAKALRERADTLVEQIDAAYWDDTLGTYCIALDADDQPVRVSTSNAGHLPFFGAALPHRLPRLFPTLTDARMLSGWGIRTVATDGARFNPMGYHNGSVWPHDNSLIAAGAAACGHTALARQITTELFDASCHFPEHRLPELWCGLSRQETAQPVAFPSACAPQAWAAGAAFLCLNACLGIGIDARASRLRIADPVLPAGLDWLEVTGLAVGDCRASLMFRAREDGSANVEIVDADDALEIEVTSTRARR
ncbi:MAG: Glycogen debranching enzyme [Rhodobacteraceae bacterium HLUCCO18]|nr:MAG: Glycogen debranching enzyme [Rhodobacteraceae bacterium HLUCCO18]